MAGVFALKSGSPGATARFPVPMSERNQAHKQNHWCGILPGGLEPHVGVACAQASRAIATPRNLVHLAVGFRHVCGTALMPADHDFNSRVMEPVQDVHETLAWNYVDPFDSVRDE